MNNLFELDICEELLAARDHINIVLSHSGIGDNPVLTVPEARMLEDTRQKLYTLWIKHYKLEKGT